MILCRRLVPARKALLIRYEVGPGGPVDLSACSLLPYDLIPNLLFPASYQFKPGNEGLDLGGAVPKLLPQLSHVAALPFLGEDDLCSEALGHLPSIEGDGYAASQRQDLQDLSGWDEHTWRILSGDAELLVGLAEEGTQVGEDDAGHLKIIIFPHERYYFRKPERKVKCILG